MHSGRGKADEEGEKAERERETHTQRERETRTHTHTDTDTHRHTQAHIHRYTDTRAHPQRRSTHKHVAEHPIPRQDVEVNALRPGHEGHEYVCTWLHAQCAHAMYCACVAR